VGRVGGVLLIIAIAIVAGGIAYVGDRVGHQVGRKRLTLFGLRPKYTSTIVAVGTGVMIALTATIVVLLTTPLARDAFFHLSEINDKVNVLQSQADQLEKQTHESNVVINRGQLLYNQFLIVTPQESQADRHKSIAQFFDAVVSQLNRTYANSGLKPNLRKSSDAETQKLLDSVLNDPRVQGFLLDGPVLLVAVADENLFPNDRISFTIAAYLDKPIFRLGQPLTSVEVDGGTAIIPNVAYGQIASAIQEEATGLGMPYYFTTLIPSLTAEQFFHQAQTTVRAGHGRYYIIARASADVYPHTGGIPVSFSLSRKPK
jgi:hypothetical protein